MPSRKGTCLIAFFSGLMLLLSPPAYPAATGVKVVCDRWPDTTSLKDFAESSCALMSAVSNEEKALALWRMIQQSTHSIYDDSIIAREPVYGITYMLDPMKILNVYGVHFCDGLARVMEMSWRTMGYRAEKYYKWGHTLVDVHYEDTDGIERWHLFDASQHWFLHTRDGSRVATPEELIGDYSLMSRPSLSPIPSAGSCYGHWGCVHAPPIEWSTHDMLLTMRPNESLERKWTNDGTVYHNVFANVSGTDMDHGPYEKTYGNGHWSYTPDFVSGGYEDGLHSAPVNLTTIGDDAKSPNLHTATTGATGTAIFSIKSPYIIADASISGSFMRQNAGDSIVISISNDDGATWDAVYTASGTGTLTVQNHNISRSFDVSESYPSGMITPFGHYDYLLKIELYAETDIRDCGIDSLTISTVTQHNIFSLPQLWPGSNNISVSGTIGADTSLRVTYVWNDKMGNDRENVTVVESTPYTYEILTDGDVWGDVVCRSVSIEAVPRLGTGNITITKEIVPDSVNTISPEDAFPTLSLIGNSYPSAHKTLAEYVTDLNTAIAAMEGNHTDDPIVWGQADNVMNALWGISEYGLSGASTKSAVLNSIRKDRSHQYTKAYACQTLYTITGGNDADVTDIFKEVLQGASSILWADDSSTAVSAGLWINTCGAAAALLGQIANEDARTAADDLVNLLDESWVESQCGYTPSQIPRWSEFRWAFVKALGKLGNASHGSVLRNILTGPYNIDERALAARGLGQVGDTSAVNDLVTALQGTGYAPMGYYCIESLGVLGDETVAPALYSYLDNWNETYRGYAATALGLLRNEKAVPYLEGLLAVETFDWVRDAAQESTDMLQGDAGKAPAAPENLKLILYQ